MSYVVFFFFVYFYYIFFFNLKHKEQLPTILLTYATYNTTYFTYNTPTYSTDTNTYTIYNIYKNNLITYPT